MRWEERGMVINRIVGLFSSSGESVFARCLSALKDERVAASKSISGPQVSFKGDREQFLEDLKQVGLILNPSLFEIRASVTRRCDLRCVGGWR